MLLSLLVPLALAAPAKVPAGKVEISAPVEVPLYSGLTTSDEYSYVEVKAGEKALLMRVSTNSSRVVLTDAAAKALGLKPGKESKKATLKSFTLGGATFENVTVYAGPLADGAPAHAAVDGEIGIGAFPDLSWAVMRSAGKLRVGPASAGAGWVAELGGGTPFTRLPSRSMKLGKEKVEFEGAPLIVELAWDGVKIPTEIVTAGATLVLTEADQAKRWFSVKGMEMPVYPLPAAPSLMVGDAKVESRTVVIGTTSEHVEVKRVGRGTRYVLNVPAQVGADVLAHYDIAIDNAGSAVALKPVASTQLASYAETYEAELRKALEPGEGKDAEAAKEGRAAAIPALAEWLFANGKVTEALALIQERTTLKPDDCEAWQDYGTYALEAGKVGDAIEGFEKSANLYAPWGEKSLEARKDLQKEFDAAKKSKGAYGGVIPQSHACFTAWGRLAAAYVVNGQPDKVEKLYPSKLDLDEGLANAAGMAALVKGDAAAAEAAFRQAIHMDPQNSEMARSGLFLAIADRNHANAQLERGNALGESAVAISAYAEAIRKLDGGAKAIEAVKAHHDKQPYNPIVTLELARQYLKDANTGAATPLLAEVRSQVARLGSPTSGSASSRTAWVLLLLAEGQTEAAKSASDALMTTWPSEATAWWAGAIVAETLGDTARAAELRRKGAMAAAANPLFVVAAAR